MRCGRDACAPPDGHPEWALYYTIYVAAALFITGIWALFEEQPAWVFTFPDNVNDAIFHLATGTIFAAVAAIQLAQDRAENRNVH